MNFVKMHGIGNDYIYFDACTDPAIEKRFASSDQVGSSPAGARLIASMSHRHTGIGSDGVILVARPTPAGAAAGAHVRMRMFNADGSEGIMCGNGIRCVAKFAHDRLGVRAVPMLVETRRGVLSINCVVADGQLVSATVDMGEPNFDLASIPADPALLNRPLAMGTNRTPQFIEIYSIEVDGERYHPKLVSMGNPHVVVTGVPMSLARLARVGPKFERHPAFPSRINVHFASWKSDNEVTMKTWERGSGITQACGTGACAVAVIGAKHESKSRDVLVHLPGGDLQIRWDESTNHVHMTGPAAVAFEGTWLDAPASRRTRTKS